MKPYYEDDWTAIYNADCRDVLGSLKGDLVLTDPPFGIGLSYGESFEDTPQYLSDLIKDVVPICRQVAPATLLTCGPANVHLYPPPTWVLSWFIPGGSASTPWGFSTWQPILAYGDDPYLKKGLGRRADSLTRSNQGARISIERSIFGHPCPKPLPAWKQILLRGSTAEGDVIIDPFMGSGTTLRAAKDLGRKAIGIEIEEKFCEAAAQRLAQEVLDLGA